MTDYPDREHEKADKTARRRALTALRELGDEIGLLTLALEQPTRRVDADTAQGLGDKVQKLTGHLAELGTLWDVREWHAAGLEDA